MGDTSERDLVGSLHKGLAVMEILARHPSGMSLSDMADEAGLTRAGARRLLLTLVASGYATQAGRRFTLSPRLLGVVRTWLSGTSLWTYAEPFMRDVAEALDESCSAAVLAGDDVLYVARVPGRRVLSVALEVGARLPAWCTSMGRVLLGSLPEDQLDRFLERTPIVARTQKSITGRGLLKQTILEGRERGFVIVDEELEIGLRSIAVPIRDRSGATVAAINVPTQSARCSVEQMEREFLPTLLQAARSIEDFFVIR